MVVTIDITLLKFLIFLSEFRRLTGLSNRLNRWTQDGVLQLQRRAYEAQRRGEWVDLEHDVPLTARKEALEDLPVESVDLSTLFGIYRDTKDKKQSDAYEEILSPRPLRSTKTWATQDTVVSLGQSSLKKSYSKDSSLKESDKE